MKGIILSIALFLVCNAFSIEVKYRGEVDVTNGHFQNLSLKYSSFIKEMHYDEKNQYLIVKLDYVYYHYCRIPSLVIEDWRLSNSLGRYYLASIKGNFDCREGGVPTYK